MPAASGSEAGSFAFRKIDLGATKTEVVGDGGLRVYGIHCDFAGAAKSYLHLYNKKQTDVTVGTTVPDRSYALPVGAVYDSQFAVPLEFDALTIAITTTPNGGAAPSATSFIQIEYRS